MYCARMESFLNNGENKCWHHKTKDDPMHAEIWKLIRAGKTDEAAKIRLADWKTFNVRSYDLRHEFCTWCCSNGVDMHTLIHWMGHANYEMVQQVYDHVTKQRIQKEVEKLENAIKSSQNSSQE